MVVPAVLLLPYPFSNLVLDVVLLCLYLGTEATRIFFGESRHGGGGTVPPGVTPGFRAPLPSPDLLGQSWDRGGAVSRVLPPPQRPGGCQTPP